MDRSTRRDDLLVDALVAAVFVAFSLIVTERIAEEGGERFDAATIALTVATVGLGLVIRRLRPELSLALVVGGLMVYTLADFAGGPIYLAPLLPLYVIASRGDRRRTAWAAGATLGAFLLVALIGPDTPAHVFYLLAFAGWVAGAVFLGTAHASRQAYLAQLEQRARDLEESREEEARRRVAEERLRIARDLHDVIAHGMATINLQSGVAAHLIERHPEQAGPSLRAIKEASGEVLAELRTTLHILREEDDDEAPLAPTPGLARVDALVQSTRAAGQPVELHLDDACLGGDLPSTVDVAAYRIVQESLSNVMRHAGPAATATVDIRRDDHHLDIEVVDDGLGAAVPTPPGHGIVGMRERVEGVGGELHTGPRIGGGYRVHARLPLAPVPA